MSSSQKVENKTNTAMTSTTSTITTTKTTNTETTTTTNPLVNSLFGEESQKHMDKYNRKAAQIMVERGHSAFIKHCFTHPETGEPMTYAEMRGFYG